MSKHRLSAWTRGCSSPASCWEPSRCALHEDRGRARWRGSMQRSPRTRATRSCGAAAPSSSDVARTSQAHADLTKAVDLGLAPALAQRDRGLIWLEAGRRGCRGVAPLRPRAIAARSADAPGPCARARRPRALARGGRGVCSRGRDRAALESRRASRTDSLDRGGRRRDAFSEAVRAADAGIAVLGPCASFAAGGPGSRSCATGASRMHSRGLDRMANTVEGSRDRVAATCRGPREGRRMQEARVAYAGALAALEGRPGTRRAPPAAKRNRSAGTRRITRLAQQERAVNARTKPARNALDGCVAIALLAVAARIARRRSRRLPRCRSVLVALSRRWLESGHAPGVHLLRRWKLGAGPRRARLRRRRRGDADPLRPERADLHVGQLHHHLLPQELHGERPRRRSRSSSSRCCATTARSCT